jgi:hypothetical protein
VSILKLNKHIKKIGTILMLATMLFTISIPAISISAEASGNGTKLASKEGLFTGKGINLQVKKFDSPENCAKYDKELEKLKKAGDKSNKDIFKQPDGKSTFTGYWKSAANFIKQGTENIIQGLIEFSTKSDCEDGIHPGVMLFTFATSIDLTGNPALMIFLTSLSFFGYLIAAIGFTITLMRMLFAGVIYNPNFILPFLGKVILVLFALVNWPFLVQDVVNITNYLIAGLADLQIPFAVVKEGM